MALLVVALAWMTNAPAAPVQFASLQTPPTIVMPPTVVVPTLPAGGLVTTVAPTTTRPPRQPGNVTIATACPPITANQVASADVIARQSRLVTTIEDVQRYAATHLDTFGELRFGGAGFGFVIVSFTGDLAPHAAAIGALVDVPAGVIVCPAVQTASSIAALQNELFAVVGDAFQSISPRDGTVVVQLKADRRTLAAELVARYGQRIRLYLGALPYPDITSPGLDGRVLCPTIPTAAKISKTIRWSTAPMSLRVHSGGDLELRLRLRNTGAATLTVEGATTAGFVTRRGSKRVIARFNGAFAAVSEPTFGPPTRTATAKGLIPTASCDPALGWSLPPGRYDVRFAVTRYLIANNVVGGGGRETIVSPPIAFTVTDEPPPPVKPLPGITAPPIIPTAVPQLGTGGPGATLPVILPPTAPPATAGAPMVPTTGATKA